MQTTDARQPPPRKAKASRGDILDLMADDGFRRTTGALAAMVAFGAAVLVPADYALFVIVPRGGEYLAALSAGKELAGDKLAAAQRKAAAVQSGLKTAGANVHVMQAAMKALPANEKLANSGLKCASAALDHRTDPDCPR